MILMRARACAWSSSGGRARPACQVTYVVSPGVAHHTGVFVGLLNEVRETSVRLRVTLQ